MDRPTGGDAPASTVRATADLLWSACRADPDHAAAEEARARGASLEWASRVAVAQRVSPLLWRVVEEWAADDDDWSVALKDDVLRCKAQALLVRPRLGAHLFEPLVAAGIAPMVVKGAAVAERYPAAGLRPMDDVDLLVRREQHEEAVDVLGRSGWRTTRRQGPSYSVTLAHTALPGLPVDLHCDLDVPAEHVFRFSATDLWAAPLRVTLFGTQVFQPTPEMELLLLATHAAKPFHNFDRLLWAVDAAVIIRAASGGGVPIDWIAVTAASWHARARSALAVLLTQAGRLGASVPQDLCRVEAGNARRFVLDPLLSATWPLEHLDDARRHRLTYAVIDDPWLKVNQFSHEIRQDGLARAPGRAVVLTWWVLRRVWRSRRTRRTTA